MIKNEYLVMLRATPEFQGIMKQVKSHRPVIPVHSINPDNTDEWKANSWMQQGFDLCLSLLGEKTNE